MRGGKVALIMAVILGGFAAVASYYYVKSLTTSIPATPMPKMAKVVVAKNAIPSRTLITSEMIYLKELPEESINPDAVTRLEDALGIITRSEILPGEQVLRSRLLKKGEAVGLVLSIPPGKRAVTVKVNEVIGVGGFVKPKDHVDVLGTFSADRAGVDTTVTVLRNVEVLAVAQEMEDRDKGKAKVPTSITLAVTPDEAERVTLAEEIGSLRLALCPISPTNYPSGAGSHTGVLKVMNVGTRISGITPKEILGEAPKPPGSPRIEVRTPEKAKITMTNLTPPKATASKRIVVAPKVVEVIRGTERSYVTLREARETE
ncbi:MAG: Flp pilus assembly protein CpaB [Firmicutes bacterium]|nr:Flp pilus assembly protein CpaB [Bacillota bacterium]